MNSLERFLKDSKRDDNKVKTDMMDFSEKKYQCQQCNKWSNGSFFDHKTLTIYWDCPDGHQSKVVLSV